MDEEPRDDQQSDEQVVIEDAEDFAPGGAELVRAGTEGTVMEVLDRYDEGQIIEAIQGRMQRSLLYDFTDDGGRQTIDLSYVGVLECVREFGARGARIRIRPDMLEIESVMEDLGNGEEPCWQATVYAEEEATGYGVFGTYTQPKRMKLKKATAERRRKNNRAVADDDTIGDVFARQKAINKAQRNALRAMIPERVRQALIATYKGDDDRVTKILAGPGAEKMAELPAPLEDEEAAELIAQAEAVYGQIREISTTALLPAAYAWMLQRSQHSHELLRALVGTLEQRLAETKETAA